MADSNQHSEIVKDILLRVGSINKIVLLEGEDDKYLFKKLFRDNLADVYFYYCDGKRKIPELFEYISSIARRKSIYAIIDRDFSSEESVEASYSDGSRYFILRRFEMENYLIESRLILVTATDIHHKKLSENCPDICEENISDFLLQKSNELRSLVIANAVFFDVRFEATIEPYTLQTNEIPAKEQIAEKLMEKLGCSNYEAISKITQKTEAFQNHFDNVENAHKVVSGKEMMTWIHRQYRFVKDINFTFRMLINQCLLQKYVPPNLKIIMERVIES
jgi:Protein of unknown function (DUF4435)